jgi:serine O-acetyltransferase
MNMFKNIREDIRSIKERDPAARTSFEVLFLYSGLHAVIAYRISHWLYIHKLYILARFISQISKFLTGIEIHPGAKIGKGLFIDHGSGVVIGETSEVGDYCTIYQGVTLGGTGKEKGKRHPTIGNNVMVGSGAKILGPFKVGDNSKVAANAVVLEEVPSDCTAVGVPARIVKRNGQKINICSDLDQIHIPDPISQEICRLYAKIDELHREIAKIKEEKKTDENL